MSLTAEEEYDAMRKQERAPEPKRMLPSSQTAEEGAICSIIIAPGEVMQLCDKLDIGPSHFHSPALAQIYRTLRGMAEAMKPIDEMTLSIELSDRGVIDQVGGFARVSELATFLPTATNAKSYLTTLCEKHTLRQIAAVGTRFHERAHDEQDNVEGVIEDFEKQVMAIRPVGRNVRCYGGKDIARMAMESLSRQLERPTEISGLTTGFADLDLKTDGMHETELIVLAGTPGTGKSSMAGQITEYLTLDKNIPVGEFSLEMGAKRYARRRILSRAHVNAIPWRDGKKPTDAEFDRLRFAAEEYMAAPYFVEELSDATVQHLRTAARRMVQQHGVKLITVDSLTVLGSNSKQGRDSRHREVAEAIQGCKEMSKELGIPVIVIAHINRDFDPKKFERPELRNLAESSAIEKAADSVWMLYERVDGQTGLYIPKQRDGAAEEECAFWFQRAFTRFRPVATQEEEADAEARRQQTLPL